MEAIPKFFTVKELCEGFVYSESEQKGLPQFGITECLIQHKCSVHTPPSHAIRSG